MTDKGNQMKTMTTEQLLSADPSSLTAEQIQQRVSIVHLRKLEREAEMVEHQNQTFQDQKEERARKARIFKDAEQATRRETENEQASCAHNTGGSGREGILNGDGVIYGSCTSVQGLPTGEIYVLCHRCAKEWHDPDNCFCGVIRPDVATKRRVLDGKFTLEEYYQQKKEFLDVKRRPRKAMEPLQGEYPTASKFRIPALETQKDLDDREFQAFLQERKREAYQ